MDGDVRHRLRGLRDDPQSARLSRLWGPSSSPSPTAGLTYLCVEGAHKHVEAVAFSSVIFFGHSLQFVLTFDEALMMSSYKNNKASALV